MGTARELGISGRGRKEGRILSVLVEDETGEEMASLSLVQKGGPEFAKRQGFCSPPVGEVGRASLVKDLCQGSGEGLNRTWGDDI